MLSCCSQAREFSASTGRLDVTPTCIRRCHLLRARGRRKLSQNRLCLRRPDPCLTYQIGLPSAHFAAVMRTDRASRSPRTIVRGDLRGESTLVPNQRTIAPRLVSRRNKRVSKGRKISSLPLEEKSFRTARRANAMLHRSTHRVTD